MYLQLEVDLLWCVWQFRECLAYHAELHAHGIERRRILNVKNNLSVFISAWPSRQLRKQLRPYVRQRIEKWIMFCRQSQKRCLEGRLECVVPSSQLRILRPPANSVLQCHSLTILSACRRPASRRCSDNKPLCARRRLLCQARQAHELTSRDPQGLRAQAEPYGRCG